MNKNFGSSIILTIDITATTTKAYPVAAWLIVSFGGDGLEDVLDCWPGFFSSPWHQRWPVSSSFLSATHSTSNKIESFLFQALATTLQEESTVIYFMSRKKVQWYISCPGRKYSDTFHVQDESTNSHDFMLTPLWLFFKAGFV